MEAMKSKFIDRFIQKVDKLDRSSLEGLMLRLADENEFLELILRSLSEGIMVCDLQGKILFFNRAAQLFLGIPENAKGDIKNYLEEVDIDFASGTFHGDVDYRNFQEVEVFYPTNRILRISLLKPAFKDKEGYLILLMSDISEHRIREKNKQESDQLNLLTTLAAGVAHEIGNPLNSLHIHLQLLERKLNKTNTKAAAKLLDMLNVCTQETNRLDSIVTQFLRAIRPSTPQLKLCSLQALVDEALVVLKPEFADRKIKLHTDFADSLPLAMVDSDQIKQAIFNLARNAMQAVGSSGNVQIRLKTNRDFNVIEVCDDGPGISPEYLDRIAEPYFTTKSEGTGLGLMIVQRIIREHGGNLEIENKEGEGAVFRIKLPLQHKRTRLLRPPEDDLQPELDFPS